MSSNGKDYLKGALEKINKNENPPDKFHQIVKSDPLYKFLESSNQSAESNSGIAITGSKNAPKETPAKKIINPAINAALESKGKIIVKLDTNGLYLIGPSNKNLFVKKNNSKGKPTQKVNRSNPVPSANNTPVTAVSRAAQIAQNVAAQSQPGLKPANRAQALDRLAAVSAQGAMAPTRPAAEAEINRSNSEKFVLINEQGYKNLLGLINAQGVTPERKGFIKIEDKETQAQECTVKLLNLNNKIIVRLRPFRKELEKYYYIGPVSGFKEVEIDGEWPTEETPVNSYRPSGIARPAPLETKKGKLSLQERRNRGEFGQRPVTQKSSAVNIRAFGTFAGKSFAKTQKNKGQKTYTASPPLGGPPINSQARTAIEKQLAEISAFPAQDAVDKARAFFIKQGISLNNLVINRLLSQAYNTEQFSEPIEREGNREWMIQRLLAKPYEKIRNNELEKMTTAEATQKEKNRFSDRNPTIGEIKEAIKRENKTANAYVSEKEKAEAKENAAEETEEAQEAQKAAAKQEAIRFFKLEGINESKVKKLITLAEVTGSFKRPSPAVIAELKLSNSEKQARNNKQRENTLQEALADIIDESSDKWVEITDLGLKTAIRSNARENAGTDVTITINGKPIIGKKIEFKGRFKLPANRFVVSAFDNGINLFMGPTTAPPQVSTVNQVPSNPVPVSIVSPAPEQAKPASVNTQSTTERTNPLPSSTQIAVSTSIPVYTPIPVQNQTKIQVYRHPTGEVYNTAFHGSDYNYELLSSTGWYLPDDTNSTTTSYVVDDNGNTMQEYTLPEANLEGGTRRRRKHHRKSKKRITKKRR
jgi:hypothetical protein